MVSGIQNIEKITIHRHIHRLHFLITTDSSQVVATGSIDNDFLADRIGYVQASFMVQGQVNGFFQFSEAVITFQIVKSSGGKIDHNHPGNTGITDIEFLAMDLKTIGFGHRFDLVPFNISNRHQGKAPPFALVHIPGGRDAGKVLNPGQIGWRRKENRAAVFRNLGPGTTTKHEGKNYQQGGKFQLTAATKK